MKTGLHGGLLLAIAAVSLTSGCIVYTANTVRGSGQIITEERPIGEVRSIELHGSAKIVVTIGEPPSLTLEGDDNILPMITTDLRGGELVISHRGSYSSRHGVTVRLTMPSLESVSLAGSGDVSVEGLSAESFRAALSGSGDITVSGTAESVSASVAGSGDINVSRLIARQVEARIVGSGDIDVHASESLNASIMGSGDITYRGNPSSVKRNVAGSGEIEPR